MRRAVTCKGYTIACSSTCESRKIIVFLMGMKHDSVGRIHWHINGSSFDNIFTPYNMFIVNIDFI